jgi:hypothetical protein
VYHSNLGSRVTKEKEKHDSSENTLGAAQFVNKCLKRHHSSTVFRTAPIMRKYIWSGTIETHLGGRIAAPVLFGVAEGPDLDAVGGHVRLADQLEGHRGISPIP